MTTPKWLEWVQQVQAIAQDGLAYTQNPFDVERFQALQKITAQVAAEYGNADFETIETTFKNEAGYATPKLDGRGVVFKDGKILMVKELIDGGWTLPGGWVDVGEPLSLAVEREVREESGYLVKARKVLAVYDRNAPRHHHTPYIFHIYKIFVQCDLIGGEASASIETEGADFFSPDQIPPLSIARVSQEEIERFFVHLRQPDLPTDFD
jgi:ADP-ribose pyrophosphatase YjhB (NUDIX family)